VKGIWLRAKVLGLEVRLHRKALTVVGFGHENNNSRPAFGKEGEWYIAQCVQVDVASQGATEVEALENLRAALELHFSPPVATIFPHVHDIEVDITPDEASALFCRSSA